MDRSKVGESNNIGRLAALLNDVRDREPPPVERWDPPYCGDIGLKICADGTWVYRDSPIRREGLIKLFASVLSKDVDGRTYLVTPAEKVDVEVEDAPQNKGLLSQSLSDDGGLGDSVADLPPERNKPSGRAGGAARQGRSRLFRGRR